MSLSSLHERCHRTFFDESYHFFRPHVNFSSLPDFTKRSIRTLLQSCKKYSWVWRSVKRLPSATKTIHTFCTLTSILVHLRIQEPRTPLASQNQNLPPWRRWCEFLSRNGCSRREHSRWAIGGIKVEHGRHSGTFFDWVQAYTDDRILWARAQLVRRAVKYYNGTRTLTSIRRYHHHGTHHWSPCFC